MIDWGLLLKTEYWFEGFVGTTTVNYAPALSINGWAFWTFIILFLSCVVVGAGASMYRTWGDQENPIMKRLPFVSTNFITLGMLGFGLFLARMLNFRFISGRFMMVAWGIYLVVVLYFIIRYLVLFFFIEYRYYKQNKLKV